LQTNRKPGIVLILESTSEFRYLQMLQSTLDYAKLDAIQVWAYTYDFQKGEGQIQYKMAAPPAGTDEKSTYWLTKSSQKRHNAARHWFQNSNGQFCTAEEGIACGQCGGKP
jgi:hypothetical protein